MPSAVAAVIAPHVTRVVIANDALYQLCDLPPQTAQGLNVEQFLTAWEQVASYPSDEWAALRGGLAAVTSGRAPFALVP